MQKRLRERLFMLSLGLGVLLCALAGRLGYAAQFTNTACGYSVTYPDGWNPLVDPDSHSLNLANFPWEQIHGGISVPPGGARIGIEMFGPPCNAILRRGDDDDTILTRQITPNTTVISRTSATSGKLARITMSVFDDRSVVTVAHKGVKTSSSPSRAARTIPTAPATSKCLTMPSPASPLRAPRRSQ